MSDLDTRLKVIAMRAVMRGVPAELMHWWRTVYVNERRYGMAAEAIATNWEQIDWDVTRTTSIVTSLTQLMEVDRAKSG